MPKAKQNDKVQVMKTKIHPKYTESKVACSCGEVFVTRSTVPEIRVEICSKCHPFYSGKQKFVDSGGRVEKFQKKYAERLQKIREVEQKAEQEKIKQRAKEQEKVEKEKEEQSAVNNQQTVEEEPKVEEEARGDSRGPEAEKEVKEEQG